jgi:hypothetical protein
LPNIVLHAIVAQITDEWFEGGIAGGVSRRPSGWLIRPIGA